ncbi:MAG: hypothetical protein DYG89_04045 [Caldilinea sp. CFX5]|nr:hypothetical protein [Caldilinea sp. CFX5]
MTEVKACIDLLRSKYYVSKIDAACGVRLLVPHQFENVSAARQFTVQRKRSYNVVKEEYSGFTVQRGSQILDGPPLPIDFYIPNASPARATNMEEKLTL